MLHYYGRSAGVSVLLLNPTPATRHVQRRFNEPSFYNVVAVKRDIETARQRYCETVRLRTSETATVVKVANASLSSDNLIVLIEL